MAWHIPKKGWWILNSHVVQEDHCDSCTMTKHIYLESPIPLPWTGDDLAIPSHYWQGCSNHTQSVTSELIVSHQYSNAVYHTLRYIGTYSLIICNGRTISYFIVWPSSFSTEKCRQEQGHTKTGNKDSMDMSTDNWKYKTKFQVQGLTFKHWINSNMLKTEVIRVNL